MRKDGCYRPRFFESAVQPSVEKSAPSSIENPINAALDRLLKAKQVVLRSRSRLSHSESGIFARPSRTRIEE